MKSGLPSYIGGHLAALAGVIALHTGIAAWAMMPEPPAVIPQQQIIHISMVAPTVIQQDANPKEVQKEVPKVPPKEKGLVKMEPEKPIEKKKEKKDNKPEQVNNSQAQTRLTSGLQSDDAIERESAITEPAPANYLNNQPPKYPLSARKNKQQGTVLLDIQVSVEGMPKLVTLKSSSGFRILDDAAIEAVKQWKFIPARRGSQVIETGVIVPIEFKINS